MAIATMLALLFTTDGELRVEGQAECPPAIARIVEGREGAGARLVCGTCEQEIVSLSPRRWAFELRDPDGRAQGGFEPFRLRRGGRLRMGERGMSLHGRPMIHDGWTFSSPEGETVEATLKTNALETLQAASADGATASRSFAVALGADGSVVQSPALAEILALGCWLIVRWHRTLGGDHALSARSRARPGRARTTFY